MAASKVRAGGHHVGLERPVPGGRAVLQGWEQVRRTQGQSGPPPAPSGSINQQEGRRPLPRGGLQLAGAEAVREEKTIW